MTTPRDAVALTDELRAERARLARDAWNAASRLDRAREAHDAAGEKHALARQALRDFDLAHPEAAPADGG